ncbi:hypothetical protein [Spiroplasma eriocheiris]|uniref:Uncharacterized protein n=1 Tax=Spiroplasma eriocheiris TaxID=315358 RepID=A0A0H3XLM1_9MOLU|nr:hypothetical protein [Spiroplasma eriocheiris]AHF57216.1 hypothetical protein SPE_0080 [Spiroplasma eriocheiris CCTCC M 207170]AKM53682.1 hypothetical protein SERIO_v1c00800 [Spiroplasma eriocheiris]
MADFDPRCFKCVNEQEKAGKGGAAANVLFNKMKQGMVGSVNDEIYVCARHK